MALSVSDTDVITEGFCDYFTNIVKGAAKGIGHSVNNYGKYLKNTNINSKSLAPTDLNEPN